MAYKAAPEVKRKGRLQVLGSTLAAVFVSNVYLNKCKKSTSTERKTVDAEDAAPMCPMLARQDLYVLLQASFSLVLWAGHQPHVQ